ncbi:uncharacterized protein LOC110450516 [Mizuhopecten yessoensis]|uniref:uncharacterized protein LOC110450516 n=1 Tax=Mizuhopecten yessoensis TaxID=6573 RepID=UPI000B45721A|nr:uncharacterized protein LOC110450516 [Mizuhopecten yessoensis]
MEDINWVKDVMMQHKTEKKDNFQTVAQVHRQIVRDEPTEQITTQLVSDEPCEQITTQLVSDEPTEQITTQLVSDEPTEQIITQIVSDEPTEQITTQLVSDELTEQVRLQMDKEQFDSQFGGAYSDPDYLPSSDDDQFDMIQDSQDESDGYCSDEYPILNTKVSVCENKISQRNRKMHQEMGLNEKEPNSISDIEQDIEVSESISDDDSTSEDEDDLLRDSGNPKIFIRKVFKSETTKTGKKKRNSRVFNSYQFCGVCNVKVSNFSQHIERHKDKHKNCPEIQQILHEKDEKERKLLQKQLRAKFNHENNMRTLKAGKGEILLERRPTINFKHDDFGPCPRCLLWIAKKLLQKHQKKCLSKNTEDCTLKKAAIQTRSDTIANRISTVASKILAKEVFETMKVDEVGTVARNDPLIVQLGNQWIQKNIGNTLKRGSYTSQIMRLVARLLLHLRKIKPLNEEPTMWNYLKPSHLDEIIKATLMTASQSVDNEEDIQKPSNAIKLGYDIKRLLNGKIGLAIKSGDKASRQDAEDLLKAMSVYWGTSVTKMSRVLLEQRHYAKDKKLPEPNDIKTLNIFLNESLKDLDLKSNTSIPDIFRKTAEVTEAKLVVYNRRRTGELQAIRLTDYKRRCTATDGESCSNMMGELSDFEKKLLETQEVMTVRGKTGRGVPVILPRETKAAMAYLTSIEVRKSAGIDIHNPYVFASQGDGHGVVRAYDALSKACKAADLKAPERITSTNLRKYMATITQVLDLKEQEMQWVLSHMGHTLDVHKIHYRATSDVIEATQIAKILLLQDTGSFGKFRNKSLQDIQLDDIVLETNKDTDEDHEVSTELFSQDDESEDLEIEEVLSISEQFEDSDHTKKRVRGGENGKGKWTKEEEDEIQELFKKQLEKKN